MRRLVAIVVLLLSVATLAAKQSLVAPVGATVVGVVTCDGEPVEGVVVSDGALFTRTDSLGVYSLPSLKHYGSVFIITPSGYEPTVKRNILPKFWAPLNIEKPMKLEQHDFALRRVDNTRHRMIFTADVHISGRNDDMLFFKRLCIPALRSAAEQVRDSMAVYSVMLGDLCRNDSWYSQEIDPADVVGMLAQMRYPAMLYTVMGEHEYDGAVPAGIMTDHLASEQYATTCAPRFYAFNVGKVHYVVLDNTYFLNDKGDGKYATEIVGKRNYNTRVSADCLAWLRRDLGYVEDNNTPIVVCMHHPTIRVSNKGKLIKNYTTEADVDSLMSCFERFGNVRFVTAHIHRRRVSEPKTIKNIKEHTVSPLSGNGWESLYNGYQHLCGDGSPAGFEVFDYDGDKLNYQFVPVEPQQTPFRIYDMRAIGKIYRENKDAQAMLKAFPDKRVNYGNKSFEEYVYINHWTAEPKTKLEVWADSVRLKPRQVFQDDPLFTLSTAVIRYRNARGRNISISRNTSSNLYRVKVDSTVKVVKVRVVDSFGREYIDSLSLAK